MTKSRKEMLLRARHHAQKLAPLAKLYSEMGRITGVKDFKTRIRLTAEGGTYLIRPIMKKGIGYVGIEIKRARSKDSIKLLAS